MGFFGERTRLACWFRRLAETIVTEKFAMARAPSPTREGACAPQLLRPQCFDRIVFGDLELRREHSRALPHAAADLAHDLNVGFQCRRWIPAFPGDTRLRRDGRLQGPEDNPLVREFFYLFGQKGDTEASGDRVNHRPFDICILQDAWAEADLLAGLCQPAPIPG